MILVLNDELKVLQTFIGFHGVGDELRKARVNFMDKEGMYKIQYLDNNVLDFIDLKENNNWKYLYTPKEMIQEILKSIIRHTEGKINGYDVIYKYNHNPLKIYYNDGEFTVKFSIHDFYEHYIQILFGIDCTMEDVFSVDGILSFENNLTLSHEYCTLSFIIPDHYREWCFVE